MNEYEIVIHNEDGLSINLRNLESWSDQVTELLKEYIPTTDELAAIVNKMTEIIDKQVDVCSEKIVELNNRILELQKVCTYLDAQIQEIKQQR